MLDLAAHGVTWKEKADGNETTKLVSSMTEWIVLCIRNFSIWLNKFLSKCSAPQSVSPIGPMQQVAGASWKKSFAPCLGSVQSTKRWSSFRKFNPNWKFFKSFKSASLESFRWFGSTVERGRHLFNYKPDLWNIFIWKMTSRALYQDSFFHAYSFEWSPHT